jgi:hypothetical protein
MCFARTGEVLQLPAFVSILERTTGRCMALSQNTRIRIYIAVALLLGWIMVLFFRSGTAWG